MIPVVLTWRIQMYVKNPRMLPSTGNQNSNTNRHLATEDNHDGLSAFANQKVRLDDTAAV